MGGDEFITEAKSGPALRRALGSAPAFAGPAGPSMPPLYMYTYMYMYGHGDPVTDITLAMDYDSLVSPAIPLPAFEGWLSARLRLTRTLEQ